MNDFLLLIPKHGRHRDIFRGRRCFEYIWVNRRVSRVITIITYSVYNIVSPRWMKLNNPPIFRKIINIPPAHSRKILNTPPGRILWFLIYFDIFWALSSFSVFVVYKFGGRLLWSHFKKSDYSIITDMFKHSIGSLGFRRKWFTAASCRKKYVAKIIRFAHQRV